jgi:hypothetical protein
LNGQVVVFSRGLTSVQAEDFFYSISKVFGNNI